MKKPFVKRAAALKYEKTEAAPRMTAKGRGKLADRILEMARENNIPVKKDEDLVELLAKLEVGEFIPEPLFPVVAEILAYVYRISKEQRKRYEEL